MFVLPGTMNPAHKQRNQKPLKLLKKSFQKIYKNNGFSFEFYGSGNGCGGCCWCFCAFLQACQNQQQRIQINWSQHTLIAY